MKYRVTIRKLDTIIHDGIYANKEDATLCANSILNSRMTNALMKGPAEYDNVGKELSTTIEEIK